jgi:opacity protein-like surface antigen
MKRLRQLPYVAIAAIAAACVIPSAYAEEAVQAPVPKRFRWDNRPLKCFAPEASQAGPMCAESANWPDWATTVSRVQNLFTEPDFDLVARAERELGFSDERFAGGEYYFDAWHWALHVMFREQPARYAETLEQWRTATGGVGYVVLAEALLREGEGWRARGGGFANTVPPEAWKIYERKLIEADSIIDSAPVALKKTGSWHALKLSIARQLGEERGVKGPVFQAAVAAWPYYRRLYRTAIGFSFPRWGGSFDEIELVVRYAYDKTKATDGAAWYATLYTDAFINDGEYTLRDSKVDWTLMKKGFRDALSKEKAGDGLVWGFARMACQMRDREETRRLYGLIDQLPESKRPRNTAADPCRTFANGANVDGAMLDARGLHRS